MDRLLQEAIAAFRAGKLDDVETLCQCILQSEPEHFASLQLLAATAGNKREPRRGIELIEKAVALHPDRPEGYVELAKLLRQDGRPADAVAALRQAIDRDSSNADAYNDLGLIHLAEGELSDALVCFDRAILSNPGLSIAHFNKGLVLERQGSLAAAIEAFRQAVSADTNFTEGYAKLANLLLDRGLHKEGIESLRRAAAAAPPDSTFALVYEAKALLEEGKVVAAEEPVRRAIERDPQSSEAYFLLGSILLQLGRFHDAAAAFDVALALNEHTIAASRELVHVKKLTEIDRPLISQMEWILREHRLSDKQKGDLHFALGKAYDDFAEYARAIEHFDEANRLKRPDRRYDPVKHAASVNRQIGRFTEEFFARNAALGSDWDVPILILGMPRSGTTLVEQILSTHPRVAAGGELTFWGEQVARFRVNPAGKVDPDWVDVAARNYRTLLTGISPTATRVTDKRPQNFHLIALIHTVFPRARIIHCRRHPVDTCLSIYFQNFARVIDFAFDRDDLLACYRQYERLMAHWRRVLPADRFLEIQYEELVADREAMTRRMIAFCGLEWNEACLHSERNSRPVRTASLWQARQPVYQTSVARWRHYEPWLGVLRDLVPPPGDQGIT